MVDSEMPWLALSPQSSQANGLLQRYDIRWVPTLIIIDGSGVTISTTGREDLTENGAAAYETWLASAGRS